jgi:DNA-binding NarL/FixJ family response regulator
VAGGGKLALVGAGLTGAMPLVGRQAEMERILARLQGPAPVAFVLAGAAGVGKTRLAAELAGLAAGRGFATAQAVGSLAAASIPFGAFAPFLPDSGHAAGDLLGLLRQASGAIAARAGPHRKLLLVVDDAQHLDDGSAALVHQLVAAGACSVLAGVRVPGPAPDLVTGLWKDGMAERIDLAAWDEAQTGEVAAAALGGPVSRATVRRLWELSGGNALFVRELLIGAAGSGALTQAGGIWSLRRPLTAPGRLVELVASRLGTLAPGTTAVIELLAAGEPLGVPLLEQITDPGCLEDAEARGFVRVGQDGRRMQARLAHPVYGEVLRQNLPATSLRRISTMLAAAIEATGARRREDLLRLGRWRLETGSPGDPALMTRAARRAQAMFDADLAARLAQGALDAGGGVEAGLTLGEARFRSGQYREAEAVLAAMAPLCRTDIELAQIANARAYNLQNLLGDGAAAAAVLDAALDAVTEDVPRLQLLGRLASMKVFEGDPEGALAAAQPLLASGDDAIISRGSHISAVALALLGRCDEAVKAVQMRPASRRRAGIVSHVPELALIGAVLGHAGAGRLDRAERDAATGQQACLAAGDAEGHATFLLLTGLVLIERGQLARASGVFLDAASVNRELHDPLALRWCLAGIALAEAMSGYQDRAMAAAAERDELPAGPMTLYETDLIDRSRAWVSVCGGDLPQARRILTAAAERTAAARMRVAEGHLRHDLARLGEAKLAASRLAALAGVVDGQYLPALAAHAAALVSGTAAEIEAAGSALEALGACLLAAEAYTAAAAAWRSDGLARRAAAAGWRAAELAAACGNPATPGLAAGAAAGRLTRREQEVAALAAAGASSRQIADRLVLSVRTVDSHLHSAYTKLGVTSRAELAQVLRS